MWTILKLTCAFVAAYAVWHSLPAKADPYPGSHASASANKLVGPGPHLVVDGDHRVVGVITDDGNVVAVNPDLVKRDPVSNVATFRLQTQRIAPEPRSWHPEPATCPRGIKVMRYGSWGC